MRIIITRIVSYQTPETPVLRTYLNGICTGLAFTFTGPKEPVKIACDLNKIKVIRALINTYLVADFAFLIQLLYIQWKRALFVN